ncbi:MAG: AI-2E family transporter [Alphaproteobacteria bacterium]|nr:AI-2E family transporter [Alphaproteobacteria bacterium]
MQVQKSNYFWFMLLIAFLFFVYIFQHVLLPFVVGIGLAYLLDPFTTKMSKWGLPRWAGTTIALLLFTIFIVFLVLLLFPLVQAQFIEFVSWFPTFLMRVKQYIEPYIAKIENYLALQNIMPLKTMANDHIGEAISWIGKFLGDIVSSGAALANLFALFFVTPVVAFYLLRDWPLIVQKIRGWFPRHHEKTLHDLFKDMDSTLAGFIRGQLIVCLILALYYGLGLTIVGLNFGLVIGILSGVLSFIPYVGSIFGFVFSMGLALVQFEEWSSIALVGVVFFSGQVIEGHFLSPVLVGNRVGLHPVWIIFALLAAASIFGFVGALLAIPFAALAGVLIRFLISKYLKSDYYGNKTQKKKIESPIA